MRTRNKETVVELRKKAKHVQHIANFYTYMRRAEMFTEVFENAVMKNLEDHYQNLLITEDNHDDMCRHQGSLRALRNIRGILEGAESKLADLNKRIADLEGS